LRHLKKISPLPWLCVGDFDESIEHFEKHGAALQPNRQMEAFREALEEYQLRDLGFIGSKFTRCNNREDTSFTKE
jgi:hypothetical protein